jgi:hypothetical protein
MLTIGAADLEAFLATFFFPFVRIAALMTSRCSPTAASRARRVSRSPCW